ncbi:phosphoribosyltransferase family protein [Methylobacterium sp. JK268]
MKVHFICGYYSDLAHRQIAKRPEDYWNANFYVWAVKMGSFKRRFYVITHDGSKRYIGKDNFAQARDGFGKFIEKRIKEEGWGDGVILVPIPSKDATLNAKSSRSLEMVTEATRATEYKNSVRDVLRWRRQLTKASEGGERRKAALKPEIELIEDVAGKNVVLIDDLLTRGGNMLAVKEVLEEAGANVLGAVVCGKTIYDFETKPFGRQVCELTEEAGDFSKAMSRVTAQIIEELAGEQ